MVATFISRLPRTSAFSECYLYVLLRKKILLLIYSLPFLFMSSFTIENIIMVLITRLPNATHLRYHGPHDCNIYDRCMNTLYMAEIRRGDDLSMSYSDAHAPQTHKSSNMVMYIFFRTTKENMSRIILIGDQVDSLMI